METHRVDVKFIATLRVGDPVVRLLAGTIPMKLKVTDIDDRFIHCGDWKFDRATGAEVDEDLGWGPNGTGSFLTEATTEH